jgi:cobalt-zinc-cadmium resistance protein CzcA
LIERLIVLSVKNRVLVMILAAIFIMLGAVASTRIAVDAVPDVTNVQIQIITPAPALGPVDVETYVTFPIERAMAGLPGLEEVRSISRAGISVVTVSFTDDTNIETARMHVGQRLEEARRSIPEGYGDPQLGPMSSGLGEIFHFEVKGDTKTLMERRTLLDWEIAPRLRLVPGVVEVNTFGGQARALEVSLDPKRMVAMRVDVAQVVEAIKKNHLAVGGSYVIDGREHVTVRGEGRAHSKKDLENIVIEIRGDAVDDRPGGTPLYLRDVAQVHEAPLVRYGAVTRDGRDDEAVVGVVMMLRGASSRETAASVKAAVADIQHTLPQGITIDAYYDRTELVRRTLHTLSKNLLEASLLVVVVLFITLANLRAGLIVAVSIPLALLGVFVGMWLGGVPGNLISLGAIDFGLVVDGAIIIIENALRRLAERREALGRVLTDEERRDVVVEAAKEVRGATAFGEAIIALVYVPIFALEGVEGRMFRPMAFTVLFALATAFVLSLTLVPALASLFLARDAHDKESFLLRRAHRAYAPLLRRSLRWPRAVALATAVLFGASVLGASHMGREFLPTLDEGTIVLAMVRLPSVSLEQALEQSRQVEKSLLKFPEVTSVVCRTGRAEIAVDPMGVNMTDVYVMLKPREEWKTASHREGLIEVLDKALQEDVPGASFAFTQPIEMNTSDLLAGISSDLAVHIYGHDTAEMQDLANKMMRVLKTIPGARDVRAEQVAGMNVLTIEVDRVAIARYGMSVEVVLDAVRAVGGVEVGEMILGAVRVPMVVRLAGAQRMSADELAQVPVRAPSGAVLPLGQLARVTSAPGPSQVHRERLSRRVTVEVNVRGRDIGSFVDEAKARLEKDAPVPPGYATSWAGDYEHLESATKRLTLVIPITLLLILVLLVTTFGEARPALVVAVNLPLSVSGGVGLLLVRGIPLSISAAVGFIALFGVAVLNGLVLISSVRRLEQQGLAVEHAAEQGAESRLRPVLTTALVASLGFLPMALAQGAGAEVQRPLATVVIGGLLSSTFVTLFVLPTIYVWSARMFGRRA